MGSRNDKFKKEFTTEQLLWMASNPNQGAKAPSDDEAVANAARRLLENGQYKNVTEKQKLTDLASAEVLSFDLDDLAKVAGFSNKEEDGKKIKAGEVFREAYFGGEKDKSVRDDWRVKIKKKYGDTAWESAKKVLQAAELDKMDKDIVDERKKAVEDVPLHQLVGFFRPRMYNAALEGRDATDKENAADIGQSLLYAIPYGKAVSAIRVLPQAGKVLAGLGTQALAPLGVSVMDDQLGIKEFDPRDVAIGAATNIGVNKVIAPKIGQGYQYLTGKIRGRMPGLAQFLEGDKTSKELAWETIDEAKKKLKAHYSESEADFLEKVAHGKPSDRLTPEEVRKYTEIVAVEDLFRNNGNNISKALTDKIKQGKSYGFKSPQAGMVGKDMAWKAESNAQEKRNVKDILEGIVSSQDKIATKDAIAALEKQPELMALFYKTPRRELENSLAGDALQNFGVNMYGKDTEATNVANLVGVDVKEVRKEQKEQKAKNAKAIAASVLSGEGLSGDDAKYIAAIKANPSIVQFGLNSGNQREDTKFRNWLLLRGNDIMRSQGSGLYRPTFDVE